MLSIEVGIFLVWTLTVISAYFWGKAFSRYEAYQQGFELGEKAMLKAIIDSWKENPSLMVDYLESKIEGKVK